MATSLASQVTSHTLYITPDDHHSTNNSNTFTLSQCLSYSEICFTSNTQLLLLPDLYKLQENFILQNLINISVIGNHSTIKCVSSSVGIAITNVTNITIHDIEVIYCSTNYITQIDCSWQHFCVKLTCQQFLTTQQYSCTIVYQSLLQNCQ